MAAHPHGLRPDDDAVAPVIGVILMVAITVVIAAGMWLLLGDYSDDTKSPRFPGTQSSDGATPTNGVDEGFLFIEHRAGECILISDLRVLVTSSSGLVFEPTVTEVGNGDGNWCVTEELRLDESSGGQLDASEAGGAVKVRIVHLPSENIVYNRLVLLA